MERERKEGRKRKEKAELIRVSDIVKPATFFSGFCYNLKTGEFLLGRVLKKKTLFDIFFAFLSFQLEFIWFLKLAKK